MVRRSLPEVKNDGIDAITPVNRVADSGLGRRFAITAALFYGKPSRMAQSAAQSRGPSPSLRAWLVQESRGRAVERGYRARAWVSCEKPLNLALKLFCSTRLPPLPDPTTVVAAPLARIGIERADVRRAAAGSSSGIFEGRIHMAGHIQDFKLLRLKFFVHG